MVQENASALLLMHGQGSDVHLGGNRYGGVKQLQRSVCSQAQAKTDQELTARTLDQVQLHFDHAYSIDMIQGELPISDHTSM
jgi:hypothetical protein